FNASTGGLTYTPAANFHGADSFSFIASDAEVDSDPATISLTILEVNNPPENISLTQVELLENEPAGSIVGTFHADDVDNDPITYEFVAGEGDTHNDLFLIDGDQLKTAAPLDYEENTVFSIRIAASDGVGS